MNMPQLSLIFFPVFLLEYGSNNYMFKACGISSDPNAGNKLAYFFDMPEELTGMTLTSGYLFLLTAVITMLTTLKKKKAEYSYSEWLRNDMFTFSLCPKSKTYRINIKTKIQLQCQKQRTGATRKWKTRGKFLETIKPMRKSDKNNRVRLLLCYLIFVFSTMRATVNTVTCAAGTAKAYNTEPHTEARKSLKH